jgi:putative aldouronate transport system permease protein
VKGATMKTAQVQVNTNLNVNKGFFSRLKKDLKINKSVYLMFLPVLAYYIIFHYKPMYGAIIAFKDYTPIKGIIRSEWIGFKNFVDFFTSFYFWRVLRNTLVISFSTLVFGFPAPIILALLINELKNKIFSRTVQTITYMPHFISMVVICGMIRTFTIDTGIINDIIAFFGGERVTLLGQPKLFVPVYVLSGIWQEVGWGSIIYLAAMAGIDQELYEASKIDGAGRWKQTLYVTLPGIAPTIVILLILRMGSLLNVGFEKIILLYSPATYETADVISSFVYRKGLQEFNWSFSSAVGLFNQVINFILLISANWISRKVNESSLW